MIRVVDVISPGGPEQLTVMEKPQPVLGPQEILIQVYASGINRSDTRQRKGTFIPPPGVSEIIGLEVSGIVKAVHISVKKWKVGQPVMALLTGGGYAEYAVCHEDTAMLIPQGLNFIEAAAIPEVWLTAYKLLHPVGGVKAGDTVLIHAGGSGVGTAAIQLCCLAGATCIITAGSEDKINFGKKLGATHGFNYKEGPFAKKLLEATDGKKVNLILDCVGASFWNENLEAIAVDGTWVVYGVLGGSELPGDVLGPLFNRGVNLKFTKLRTRPLEYKKRLVESFVAATMSQFSSKHLKPIVDKTFSLEEVGEGHRLIESNQTIGKLVLKVLKGAEKEL